MGFSWYKEVSFNEPITQGDIILDFPVPIIEYRDEYPFFIAGGAVFDVIVMSQACDVENGKLDEISFCVISPLDEIVESMMKKELGIQTDVNVDTLTTKQLRMPRNFVDQLRRGQHTNYYLLNEHYNELADKITVDMDGQVVLLKKTYQLPMDSVASIMKEKSINRLRLLPPYREHLAQAYANVYSRIGLPTDINHKEIKLKKY